MNISVLDCESTTSNKGNPFDQTNKLCAVGIRCYPADYGGAFKIDYDETPYGDSLAQIKTWVERDTDLLVLFNAKFDLNWCWRYGISYNKRLWDCQLFEFFDSHQNWIFPDLETACAKRGVQESKSHDIEQYWDNGIDTPAIPWHIVEARVTSDVLLTWALYQKQKEVFDTWSKARQNLFRLHCADTLVLQQIERNGFHYDEEKSKAEADKTTARILEVKGIIYDIICDSRPNLDSNDNVSAILYGGTIKYESKTESGVFKTGIKAGQKKYRWVEEIVTYPCLVQPLKHTETAKKGIYSVDKGVLGKLMWKKLSKIKHQLISALIEYSREQRSLTSYSAGLPKMIEKMHWPRNMLYGSINQCIVRTGRTSSSKPNLQNFDSDLKGLFTSRYS